MFEMKVQTKYYQLLKNGIKTIELRLFDEKRQQKYGVLGIEVKKI